MALLDRVSHGYVATSPQSQTSRADVEDYKVLIPTWLAMVSNWMLIQETTLKCRYLTSSALGEFASYRDTLSDTKVQIRFPVSNDLDADGIPSRERPTPDCPRVSLYIRALNPSDPVVTSLAVSLPS
jgi:hypothetical protein